MPFCPCQRCDNEKASATVNLVDEQLSQLINEIIETRTYQTNISVGMVFT